MRQLKMSYIIQNSLKRVCIFCIKSRIFLIGFWTTLHLLKGCFGCPAGFKIRCNLPNSMSSCRGQKSCLCVVGFNSLNIFFLLSNKQWFKDIISGYLFPMFRTIHFVIRFDFLVTPWNTTLVAYYALWLYVDKNTYAALSTKVTSKWQKHSIV
jgi:hypothetical protein